MSWLVAHEVSVIGVIWMLVLGPAVGNYACSVIYRLPIGKTPFERHPFCGHCNADLKPRDLFPIISWCMTGGRCRYCKGKIPALYTVVEVACALIFVAYFLKFGIGEKFLLVTLCGVFVIILAGIEWQKGWVAESVFVYALTSVALLRTLTEGTIFGWVHGGFIMLVATVSAYWLYAKVRNKKFKPFAMNWIWWLTLLGALVPQKQWALLVVPGVFLLIFFFGPKRLRSLAIIPVVASALYLPLVIHA